jgi:hypothetical protein
MYRRNIRIILDQKFWLLRRALRAVGEQFNRDNYEHARIFGVGDSYEIRSKDAAEYFGFAWKGRPFVVNATVGYDLFDYAIDIVALFWYIMSGQEAEDLGREADEQLLSYAY